MSLENVKSCITHGESVFLKDKFPEIYKQIHPTLNSHINIETLSYGEKKVLWWKCSKSSCDHHVWSAKINTRTSGKGCPYCVNQKTCPCDSFASKYPKILEEFDYRLNENIDPFTISPGSNKLLWWRCSKSKCDHHVWQTSVKFRVKGSGCLFCAKNKVCPCNSLLNKYPNLIDELDTSLNVGIDIATLPTQSDRLLWWTCRKSKCQHPHSWQSSIKNRTKGSGCPFCSGQKICKCTSFGSNYPELLKEFDYEANMHIDPYSLSCGSIQKVSWKCSKCQHKWCVPIRNRTRNETGCPKCRQSHLEKKCETILKNHGIVYDTQKKFEGCKYINHLLFDFYISDHNIAIELDGVQHFEGLRFDGDSKANFECIKMRDEIKNTYCKQNNINLLRISYSEINNMETHIAEFIDAVRKTTNAIQKFVGKEY